MAYVSDENLVRRMILLWEHICLSIYLSTNLCIYLSVYRSISLSIFLSATLSPIAQRYLSTIIYIYIYYIYNIIYIIWLYITIIYIYIYIYIYIISTSQRNFLKRQICFWFVRHSLKNTLSLGLSKVNELGSFQKRHIHTVPLIVKNHQFTFLIS